MHNTQSRLPVNDNDVITLGATIGTFEAVVFFLSGLQKLEQRAKKCIELRGQYVEFIPSLVAVACFLTGRAKDLSAPPRKAVIATEFNQTLSG